MKGRDIIWRVIEEPVAPNVTDILKLNITGNITQPEKSGPRHIAIFGKQRILFCGSSVLTYLPSPRIGSMRFKRNHLLSWSQWFPSSPKTTRPSCSELLSSQTTPPDTARIGLAVRLSSCLAPTSSRRPTSTTANHKVSRLGVAVIHSPLSSLSTNSKLYIYYAIVLSTINTTTLT